MYMETDRYDAGKAVEDLITNGYEYAAGEVAVTIAKKVIPQFAKYVSGVGYVLTAKEVIDIVEELRLTSIMDEHSGAKIEAYGYSAETIMDSDEASGTIAHHVNKNVLITTNTVDEKEVVVGFISSGQAVDVRTGTFYEGRTPHAMSILDIAGSYIGDYVIE